MRLDLQPCDLGKAPRGGAYGSRRSSAVPRGEQGHDRGTPGQVCSSPQVYGCLHARLHTTAEATFTTYASVSETSRRGSWKGESAGRSSLGSRRVRAIRSFAEPLPN